MKNYYNLLNFPKTSVKPSKLISWQVNPPAPTTTPERREGVRQTPLTPEEVREYTELCYNFYDLIEELAPAGTRKKEIPIEGYDSISLYSSGVSSSVKVEKGGHELHIWFEIRDMVFVSFDGEGKGEFSTDEFIDSMGGKPNRDMRRNAKQIMAKVRKFYELLRAKKDADEEAFRDM